MHAPESCTRLVWQLLPRLSYRDDRKSKEKHRKLQDSENRWRLQHQCCCVSDKEEAKT